MNGTPDIYLLPLAMTFGEAAERIATAAPNAVVAAIVSERVAGLLHDGVFDDKACASCSR